ncbi:hypothetical protein LTS18_000369 [Coniosporium uncinatum]|uniref:Uncharacterized protein n=1 Tax=Coniosporium uncinatum TaxID=93489 RepID=A0ACC3DFU8_9PEZI|nr:hypothetical protein LTS18_000369 [Coniosporium uncinatum]
MSGIYVLPLRFKRRPPPVPQQHKLHSISVETENEETSDLKTIPQLTSLIRISTPEDIIAELSAARKPVLADIINTPRMSTKNDMTSTDGEMQSADKLEDANNVKRSDEPGAQRGTFTGRIDILTNNLESTQLATNGDNKDPQLPITERINCVNLPDFFTHFVASDAVINPHYKMVRVEVEQIMMAELGVDEEQYKKHLKAAFSYFPSVQFPDASAAKLKTVAL